MRADTVKFYDSIKTLDRDSLLSFCVDLYERKRSAEIECSEQEKIATEAAILYQQEKKAHIKTAAELAECQKLIQKLSEQNDLKTRAIFGRNTEKMLDMLKQASDPTEEFEDESQIEDNGKSPKKSAKITSLEKYKKHREQAGKDYSDKNPEGEERAKGKTRRRRLKESLEKLPFRTDFDLDVEKLNELFGKGNWRIAHWKVHYKIEKIECPIYVRRTYTPVISSGLEHVMTTIPYRNPLLDRSYLSESFAADFLYRKFYLSLPDYRQSFDYQMQGLDVSRQDLIVWTNKLVLRIMPVIRDYLLDLFLKCVYSQCDESFLLVNRDGRSAGTKSIMWVHSTSELLGIPPIVLFFYEATRGTEHLRFLLAEFHGYITCDAYVSYQVIEKESNGRIITTGCLMHCRRYFALAFFVNDIVNMSEDQIMELPETKALLLIREIYHEENQLKNMTADDRLKARQEFVEPKVDALFKYIHELNLSGEVFPDKLNKAIKYAINQENCLRRFLSDGNIPCDNGNSERLIRSYSVGRANWLFADTVRGAEVLALMYTVVETAKANQANVYTYIKYLLENIPRHLDDAGNLVDRAFLPDMVPWSNAYHKYELESRENARQLCGCLFPVATAPKAPGKAKAVPKDAWENTA